MEISFYQLQITPLEKALPRLLEKAYEAGHRVLVLANDNHIKLLDDVLWTYSTNKFLPHGIKDPEKQPIFISNKAENQNNATVLAVTNGVPVQDFSNFQKVLDVFDGNSEPQLTAARDRWKSYKSQGLTMRYWCQDDKGAWVEKA